MPTTGDIVAEDSMFTTSWMATIYLLRRTGPGTGDVESIFSSKIYATSHFIGFTRGGLNKETMMRRLIFILMN